MKLRFFALALGLLTPLTGCDTDEDETSSSDTEGASGEGASGEGASAGGPSDGAVDGCRSACDKLQFFDCIDGSTHGTCWNTCPERGDDDLELFESCVNNSSPSCDPDCLDGLFDAPEPEPETTTTTTGAEPSGCEDACQSYVDAGCDLEFFEEVVSCGQACATLSLIEQGAAAICLNSPQTCEVDPACLEVEEEETGVADETGDSADFFCLAACDELLALECIDAQQNEDCFAACGVAPSSEVDAFVSCVDNVSFDCEGSCYAVFIG